MAASTKRSFTSGIVWIGVVLWVGMGLADFSEAKDLTKVLSQGMGINAPGINTVAVAEAIAPGIAAGISQAVTLESPQAAVFPAFASRYNPTLTVFERTTTVPDPLYGSVSATSCVLLAIFLEPIKCNDIADASFGYGMPRGQRGQCSLATSYP